MDSRWPRDYFLFPKLKEHLPGTRFSSESDVKAAAVNWLNGQGRDFYQFGLNKRMIPSLNMPGRLRRMDSRWPRDYFLSPKLKEHLSGTRFSSESDVKAAAVNWLNGQGRDFYQFGLIKFTGNPKLSLSKVHGHLPIDDSLVPCLKCRPKIRKNNTELYT
ncbi:hypothetical protein AVEN_17240-1 [Araneus ventricosus]|uniref:Uncharacterized protein n=2 Tax=Araneus ventricosus TaxID=182803 RepID=A0A4Y2VLG0_ARAVE|nr:hypothetical protein AVEN_17240-1 [Araneus ventricosus]